ncbi:MAG: PKD domain-containing protein [Janthinobacterium lividum]
MLAVATILALPTAAHAQYAAADPSVVECGPVQPAELCVDFDASRSVDAGAGPLEYRWNMGDGTTLTGLTITYCYKTRAHYQVTLDVAVPATGEVRRAERTFDVDLTRKPVLNFSVGPALNVRVGQPVTFDALDSVLPDCQSVVVVWDFRDGYTQQGRRAEHTFRKAGRFAVRMSMRGYGPGSCAASNCVSQEVVVEP